jgi:hypothetical protein
LMSSKKLFQDELEYNHTLKTTKLIDDHIQCGCKDL